MKKEKSRNPSLRKVRKGMDGVRYKEGPMSSDKDDGSGHRPRGDSKTKNYLLWTIERCRGSDRRYGLDRHNRWEAQLTNIMKGNGSVGRVEREKMTSK